MTPFPVVAQPIATPEAHGMCEVLMYEHALQFLANRPRFFLAAVCVIGMTLTGCSNAEGVASKNPLSATPIGTSMEVSGAALDGTDQPVIHNVRAFPPDDDRNVAADVTFPPRNEPFNFRRDILEPKYRNELRRPLQLSFVDI